MNERIYQPWNYFRGSDIDFLKNLRGLRRNFQGGPKVKCYQNNTLVTIKYKGCMK